MGIGFLPRNLADAAAVRHEWGSIQWIAGAAVGNAQGITVGRVVIRKGFANPGHCHPTCEEVLHLLRGRLEHAVGDQTVVLNPGDTLVIEPGVVHRARSLGEEDAEMIVAYPSGRRDFVLA